MFKYIIKRIVYFFPTLIIISLLTFGLSKITPGDPVKLALGNKDNGGEAGQSMEKMANEKAYLDKAENLGLNLPNFYVSLVSSGAPDTLHHYVKRSDKELLEKFIAQYGNWPKIEEYFSQIKKLEYSLFDVAVNDSNFEAMKNVRQLVNLLYLEDKDKHITTILTKINQYTQAPGMHKIKGSFDAVNEAYLLMKSQATPYKNYIPKLIWYGSKNQYHRWIFGDAPWFGSEKKSYETEGFIRGDFGNSYLDSRPISSKLKEAIPYTLALNIIALIFSYLISIPVGVWSARNKDNKSDKVASVVLFMMNSLPAFWVGTMLVVFVTNSEYGMDWFPTHGPGEVSDDMGFFESFGIRLYHMALPSFCMIYGGIAYLSRQMRGGMLNVLKQDYIRTARAKGNPENVVIWKHAFKNSLIPIITLLASIFPSMIAGSFAIEFIFSIPGMGKLTLEALTARDFPMIFTVMLISAVLTLIGNLVADILYGVVDPRISFDK
ncbi:MAG: ABC transporter permease [Chitinophagales bacterium]|jgi:peptide/nickel transport system permease protein|nr:ABC transporter permease [Chitinophagales bacterium]